MNAEGWSEFPTERRRLLRMLQAAVNAQTYRRVVVVSGDVHFGELQRFIVPEKREGIRIASSAP